MHSNTVLLIGFLQNPAIAPYLEPKHAGWYFLYIITINIIFSNPHSEAIVFLEHLFYARHCFEDLTHMDELDEFS